MLSTWLVLVGALMIIAISPYLLFLGVCGVVTLMRREPRCEIPLQARFAFVVPAHNEEMALGKTLESLQAVDYPLEMVTVVVIADNCTDRTADVGRSYSVQVIERQDQVRRSKGHALADVLPKIFELPDFGAVDAVVIVDADTVVDRAVLRELNGKVMAGADWIQGLDIVGNPLESWRTKLMAFGFALFNGSFQIGSEWLGVGAHLRGNGMCLSRRGLARLPWTAGGLAEDLEFSWQLRLRGERVCFASRAQFLAEMPISAKASVTQRQRWEKGRHGLWSRVKTQVLGAQAGTWRKCLWVLDLTMPSFTALVAIYAFSVGLLGLACGLDPEAVPWPLGIWATCLGFMITTYSFSPFIALGLSWRVLSAVLLLPYFVLWRGLIAIGSQPTKWVRTERRQP